MNFEVPSPRNGLLISPTLSRQCWGFAAGSSLFALGSAPGFASVVGATGTNMAYFIGAWFFTGAAAIQLALAGPMTGTRSDPPMIRADWLAAVVQFLGTLLFNISTGAALRAHSIPEQKHLVWTPDAAGSVAFLISGVAAVIGFTHAARLFEPQSREWWAVWINLIGCVAFGASAVGGFVTTAGATEDAILANSGTFVGALCFVAAALILLPRRQHPRG
ncbi:hypothetical protein ABH922_000239 [Rhodococcus sp. 27YEA15]|uniref:hypothetical protein n=1 Tax=Rhodococcus sp. 27YEA15 TaxID=3156259 RepID=UPI003C79ABF3